MDYYSFNGQEPTTLPDRILMPNGMTRTDKSTFTEEELELAGWKKANPKPGVQSTTQKVVWSQDLKDWAIVEKTQLEIEEELRRAWEQVKSTRDQMMKDFDWRYMRHSREVRLGLNPTEDIVKMDVYMQALADITNQDSPYHIVWPYYAI
jgi:hypothetical protein